MVRSGSSRAVARPPKAPAHRLASVGLTTTDLVFFVLAAAAPIAVVAGAMPLAIRTGGLGAAYGYLVPGAVLLLFAIGFTAMSPLITNAGAFYAYICRGLCRPPGVGAALVALLAYNAMTVSMLAGVAYFTHDMLKTMFGVNIAWPIIAAFAIAGVALLGYFKVTLGAKVLGVALGLEVLVLVVYEVVMLAQGGSHQLATEVLDPSLPGGAGFGALLVVTTGGFIGFEATALYAEEAKDPARTIPRATYIAIGFLALFYAFSAWCVFVAYGPQEALQFAKGDNVSEMVFVSITQYVGPWASDFAKLLLCTSSFAAALAFHNAAARYFFALGRQRILPTALAKVSKRHGTPSNGTIAQTCVSVLCIGLAAALGADPYLTVFIWAAAPGTLGILAIEAVVAVSITVFFFTDRRGHSVWRVTVVPIAAAIGLVALTGLCVWQIDLLTGASAVVSTTLLLPVLVLFVIGVALAFRIRSRDRDAYDQLGAEDIEKMTAV